MEELEPQRTRQWARFLTLVAALVAMAGVLVALMGVTLAHAREATGYVRGWLTRLAVVCVAMLGVILIALASVVVRFVLARAPVSHRPTRTEHVDAWALAGKRFQLPQDEEPPEDDDPGQQGETREGPG